MESKFKLISIGQVVKDKEDDSLEVDVFLPELMPSLNGVLTMAESIKNFSKSTFGEHVYTTIQKRKTIRAKWINMYNSNRITPPDVVANEYVHIYQNAGSDEYFWASIGTNLRKKERVINYYSNKNESKPNESCFEEGYYTMVDTKDKQIVLHTSDNDGEKSQYDFILDTGDGTVLLKDKQGNYIHISSTKNNGIQSININDTVQIKTANLVHDTSDTHTISTNEQVLNNNNLTINVSGNCTINAPKFGVFGNGEEIIQIIIDFIQESMDEQHIGNLGIPTMIHGESRAKLEKIKERLSKFLCGGGSNTGKKYQDVE